MNDIHNETAALVFNIDIKTVTPEQRRQGKLVNYFKVYGRDINDLEVCSTCASFKVKGYPCSTCIKKE